jgi:hypothetical protein
MKNRLTISQVLILCIVFTQVIGGFENQVSAATQIAKKSSLVSLCLNPAGNSARAAQDDRCIEGSENQVSAATQITKKTSLVSLCLNPAGNAARAAQDDRCSKGAVTSSTTTTVPAKTVKTVKPVETTEPVKTNNKNVASAVGTTVPVIANVSNISTGTSSASGSNLAVVLPVEIPGLISVCVNKSTSVLRDTADNSCSSDNEVKVEWLDSGASPKICVNNNNRQMTLAQDGKCATKNSAVADVTVNKQILACADDKTGVLRYQKSGICATNDDPVVWVLKDQGVARNVDSGVKKGVVEIISLIPTGRAGGNAGAGTSSGANTGGSTKTVTTSPTANTSSPTTTTTTAVATAITTTTTSSTTTTTVASRVSGSFAGYLGGTCPDGSGIPWYWGSGGQARAGGCSAAASIAPISTGGSGSSGSAATTTTAAPVVVPGTPATPTGVAGNAQVTVTVAAGSGGTPTSYTVSASPQVSGVTRTCTVTGASGSCVVTGLTNGTAYTFTTTATNSAGTSSASTASSSVTPEVVPGTPATPTSYTITKSTDGVTYSTGCTVTVPASSCVVTGLTNGTAYTFKTTATNSAGTSGLSSASASVTPATVYTVGSTGPGGGFVFYVQAGGGTFTSTGSDCNTACKYLEVAPINQSTGIVWATTAAFCYAAGSDSGTSDCQNNSIYSNTAGQAASRTASTAIGMGMANTNQAYARVSNNGAGGGAATSTYAVGLAWAYENNGKTDWHLPSKDELNQLCKWNGGVTWTSNDQTCNGAGGTLNSATNGASTSAMSTVTYWSSSEFSLAATQSQNFPTGWVNEGFGKVETSSKYTRAVRAFG